MATWTADRVDLRILYHYRGRERVAFSKRCSRCDFGNDELANCSLECLRPLVIIETKALSSICKTTYTADLGSRNKQHARHSVQLIAFAWEWGLNCGESDAALDTSRFFEGASKTLTARTAAPSALVPPSNPPSITNGAMSSIPSP